MPTDLARQLCTIIGSTASFPIPAFAVDRLLGLLGDDEIVYSDSGMQRAAPEQSPTGALVIFTQTKVLRQIVTDAGGSLTIAVAVAPRNALRAVTSEGPVTYHPASAAGQSEWSWPWDGQLQAHYLGVPGPVVLPAIPNHRLTVEPFREFLPSLLADLDH